MTEPPAACARGPFSIQCGHFTVNISKAEQRTLHALAQGGAILTEKDARGKIAGVNCITREGWSLADCTPALFARLRRRGFIASAGGGPYRLTLEGRAAVRPQADNRA